MTRKPRGKNYRNLVARGGAIWYRRMIHGKLVSFSCRTDDWNVAAEVRNLYEAQRNLAGAHFVEPAPSFEEAAAAYLEAKPAETKVPGSRFRLASATLSDRIGQLRKDGPIVGFFCTRPVDEISRVLIGDWWESQIAGRYANQTGLNYLSALSKVLRHCVGKGWIERNPARDFREWFLDESTKRPARIGGKFVRSRAGRRSPVYLTLPITRRSARSGAIYATMRRSSPCSKRDSDPQRWGD